MSKATPATTVPHVSAKDGFTPRCREALQYVDWAAEGAWGAEEGNGTIVLVALSVAALRDIRELVELMERAKQ